MTSYLQEQMKQLETQKEQIKRQQDALALKIKNSKLDKEASIEHLETLIEPITHRLNMSAQVCKYEQDRQIMLTFRDVFKLETDQTKRVCMGPQISLLTNEQIFITLLGIIKKQDARIGELELLLRG